MRLNKVAFVFALGLCFCAQAEDNVFVDLSVLDNLNGAYIAPREPLFPVLPKKEKAVKPKVKAPVKKAVAKKQRPAPVIEVKEEKAPVTLPAAEEKITEPEVVVVDVEPAAPEIEEAAPVAAPVVAAPSSEPEQPANTEPVVEEKAEMSVADAPASEEPAAENTGAEEPVAAVVGQPQLLQPAEVVSAAEETKPALLVDKTAAPQPEMPVDGRSIVFADGEDELTPEQMSKIDDIIGRFKDINTNKIAIYSYNLDDGVDSFRKKRVSLNRAVGIRGYLIKQGYKNFSIKVININSGSDKINTVELEEI